MSSHKGPRTAARGAETASFLACTPVAELKELCAPGSITGRFFFDKRPLIGFEAEWAPEGSGVAPFSPVFT